MGLFNIITLCVNRRACEENNNIMEKFSSEEEITKKTSHTIEEVLDSIEEVPKKIEDMKTSQP